MSSFPQEGGDNGSGGGFDNQNQFGGAAGDVGYNGGGDNLHGPGGLQVNGFLQAPPNAAPVRSNSGGSIPTNILSRGQALPNFLGPGMVGSNTMQPFGVNSSPGGGLGGGYGGYDQQSSALSFARFQQQREEEFKIQSEDFPALGAAPKAGAAASPSSEGFNQQPPMQMQQQHQQQQQGGNNRGLAGPGPIPAQLSIPTNNNLQFSQQLPRGGNRPGLVPTTAVAVAPSPPQPPAQKDPKYYGLMGLLDVVKTQDKDLNMLALGHDLTTLGLSLNSAESLYTSFGSPFVDSSSSEAQFTTPTCYMNHPPSFKIEHLARIQVETLFYMFYSMPRDIMQAYAAQELYNREWRFHGELKLWFKKGAPDAHNNNQQQQQQQQLQDSYSYFDITTWEPKLFNQSGRGNLASGFLPEEETRIKQNTSD